MATYYSEMEKLMMYLEVEKIPYEVREHTFTHSVQLFYPSYAEAKCDVICHEFSYGGPEGYLEIMGLLTDEEAEHDEVAGWLTAVNIFNRIYNDYNGR